MPKIVVCDGEIIQAFFGGDDLPGVVACSVGWTVQELPSQQQAAGTFDLGFVGLLFVAFALGFHKGGQR